MANGLCECGCGQPTALSQITNARLGCRKGEPNRFIIGHHQNGERNVRWNGGRSINEQGYVQLSKPSPRSRRPLEHIEIAVRALGRSLPSQAQVHHVDGDRANNANRNLVVCQDDAYHKLLHRRQKALAACGDPNAHKCGICKRWDRQEDMTVLVSRGHFKSFHRSCNATAARERRARLTSALVDSGETI
jgi:hypothetical protein